jgi:hypothetical protein
MDFTEVINKAKRFTENEKNKNYYDDLLIDRLHNRYTVAALVCFCVAVSSYDFLGKRKKID